MLEPTNWALAIGAEAASYAMAEMGRVHPYEEGKNQGKPVPETAVRRILRNLQIFREGRSSRVDSPRNGTATSHRKS